MALHVRYSSGRTSANSEAVAVLMLTVLIGLELLGAIDIMGGAVELDAGVLLGGCVSLEGGGLLDIGLLLDGG